MKETMDTWRGRDFLKLGPEKMVRKSIYFMDVIFQQRQNWATFYQDLC